MSQKISNSTEALIGLLVLSITAKTEQHSRMATRSASQLIKRFRIPVDLVESCKTYVEQIMADHRSKFFVVDGLVDDNYPGRRIDSSDLLLVLTRCLT